MLLTTAISLALTGAGPEGVVKDLGSGRVKMKRRLAGYLVALVTIAVISMQVAAWSLSAPLAAIAVVASSPSVSYAQWWKTVDGCLAFEHRDYTGAEFVVDATMTYSYVGGRWNDRISSVRCEVFCSLTAWEHRDYGGATRTFGDDTRYVGGAWNDRISSMEANCEE